MDTHRNHFWNKVVSYKPSDMCFKSKLLHQRLYTVPKQYKLSPLAFVFALAKVLFHSRQGRYRRNLPIKINYSCIGIKLCDGFFDPKNYLIKLLVGLQKPRLWSHFPIDFYKIGIYGKLRMRHISLYMNRIQQYKIQND